MLTRVFRPIGRGSAITPRIPCKLQKRQCRDAEDWDALESELAGDGWAYRTPNRGHLDLR